jgi:D-alanine transaminase
MPFEPSTPSGTIWNSRQPVGRIAYVNGRYVPHAQASVHVEDRGLQFADAVYEVMTVVADDIFDEEEHLDRLERSLREIGMAMPIARTSLKFVFREIARRNGIENGLIYLQITRGAVRRDHPIPSQSPKPTLILTARSVDTAAIDQRRRAGIRVVTLPDQRWARCDIKSTGLLPNVLAKTVARRAGAYEAWLVDRDGFVTEGTSTTAWIVDGEGRLIARDLSSAILPGVTRRVALEAAAEAQMPIVERRFTPAEAASAREAFLSAATAGIIPIVAIDGKPIGDGKPGPVTRRLQELYLAAAAKKAHPAKAR